MKPLLIIMAFLTLCSLGVWQIHRLGEKTALLAHMQAQLTAPPIDLDTTAAGDWDYRHIRLIGFYLNDHQFLIQSRVRAGVNGVHVVTPFRDLGGHLWLVNRGWLPTMRKGETAPVMGETIITGIARRPPKPGWMTPPNDPGRNLWFAHAPLAMLRAAGITATPEAYVIELDKSAGSAGPIGGVTNFDLPNNHLHYAVTWFALALALLVIVCLRSGWTPFKISDAKAKERRQ